MLRRLPIQIVLALVLAGCGKTHQPTGALEVDASVAFDPTPVGGATTRKVVVKDTGKGPLKLRVQAEYPFTATPGTVDLAPGTFTTLTVRFAPEHEGDYHRVLRLDHGGAGPSSMDLIGSAACVCDDGDACTTDTCGEHGACVATPVSCPEAAGLCWSSVCDPRTGCGQVPVTDGTSCGSGQGLCGGGASCQGGECVVDPTGLSPIFSIDLPARAGRVLADHDGNLYFVVDGQQLRSYDITGAVRFMVDSHGATDLELVDDGQNRVVASGPAAICDQYLCEHLMAFGLDGAFAWDAELPAFTRGPPPPATFTLAVAAAGDRYWIAQMLGPASCSPTTSWLSRVQASSGTTADAPHGFSDPPILDLIADENDLPWFALGPACDPSSPIAWRVRNPEGSSAAPIGPSSRRISAFGGRVFVEDGEWSTVNAGMLQGFFNVISGFLQPAVSSLGGAIDIPPLGSDQAGWRVGCDGSCGDPSQAGVAVAYFSDALSDSSSLYHVAAGAMAPGPLLLDDGSVLVATGASLLEVTKAGTPLSCELGMDREIFSLVTVAHETVVAVVGPPATRSLVGYALPLHLAPSGWVATGGNPGRTRHPL